ncbi:hypothetical protein LQ236_000807 [Nitrospina gracilis]|nr:hypothetical protein [Nitrospina sp. Nb-3]
MATNIASQPGTVKKQNKNKDDKERMDLKCQVNQKQSTEKPQNVNFNEFLSLGAHVFQYKGRGGDVYRDAESGCIVLLKIL